MRLRVDSARLRSRIAVERGLHALALVLLGVLLWKSVVPGAPAPNVVSTTDSLARTLARWSTSALPSEVYVDVRSDISPVQRDWLRGLLGARVAVTWAGAGLVPFATATEPTVDPDGATSVWSAAPSGSAISISDALGPLDSIVARGAGGRVVLRSAPTHVRVSAGPLIARAAVTDSLALKHLLVLGRVGWEAKFVIAALEERGWQIDARLSLSPKGDVIQTVDSGRHTVDEVRGPRSEVRGSHPSPVSASAALGAHRSALRIDTSTYSAVIALDSSASEQATPLLAYVRTGGGLILGATAARAAAFAAGSVGSLGTEVKARMSFASAASDPRGALMLAPIALAADAVPVEVRDSLVAIAARRLERGRVVVVGYGDTWRWRMGGGEDAVLDYRDWWADLVATVAYAGLTPRAASFAVDEAPFAHLIDRLGPPSTPHVGSRPLSRFPASWLFALLAIALVVEWSSRRLRGAA